MSWTNGSACWPWSFDFHVLDWFSLEGMYAFDMETYLVHDVVSVLCYLQLTFPYNWDWKTSLLLGALLGATDPVAVVALLKELGASKKMTTIIDGESLMNDG